MTKMAAMPIYGNVVLLFRENFVCLYLFLSLKTLSTSLLSLLFMIEILLPYYFKILSPTLFLLFRWRALESLIFGKNLLKKSSSPELKGQWPWGLVWSIGDMGPVKFEKIITLG